MRTIHQQNLLKLIEKGKYKVDTEQGCVYSYRVKKDSWDRLKGTKNKYGFRQLDLYYGRGGLFKLRVYEHVAVWIAGYGLIPPGSEIKHKDGDPSNNKLWNLFLIVTPKKNIKVRAIGQLTAEQAEEIWKLYKSGMTNHCRIAEELFIDRQKVRRCILKYEAGESFRFEHNHGHNSLIGHSLRNQRQSA